MAEVRLLTPSFTDGPTPEYLMLVKPWSFIFRGNTIWIPAGFTWDRASVPWPVLWLIQGTSLGSGPPLEHDFLYRHHGELVLENGIHLSYSRKLADLHFYRRMREWPEVDWWKERAAYRAVRLGGGPSWRASRRFASSHPTWNRILPHELSEAA